MKDVRRQMKFVRMLFGQAMQVFDDELVTLINGKTRCSLPLKDCNALLQQGVLAKNGGELRSTKDARTWLKRHQLMLADNAASVEVESAPVLQSDNDTILRLAKEKKGQSAFLSPHHILAANRISALIQKSQLRPNITQNLSALSQYSGKSPTSGTDVSDMAIDNRTRLANLTGQLPKDCASVVIDICGFDKGLQQIEFERSWPRRSAKLILRIGLEQIAEILKLRSCATGNHVNNWC